MKALGLGRMAEEWVMQDIQKKRPCPNYRSADLSPTLSEVAILTEKMRNELQIIMDAKFHITSYRIRAPRAPKGP